MMAKQKNILTTVVSYPDRGEGGNSKYRGNCSPKLISDLIAHFGPQEICDYMCGSNTTADVAANMGIMSHTYDLHSGFDLLHCDIPERPQFIFWHPPYWDIIKYSDVMYRAADVQQRYGYDPRQYDLSRIPTWEAFVNAMNYCMMKQFCALEKGGRMAVLVGDIKKKGKLLSMLFELTKPGTLENGRLSASLMESCAASCFAAAHFSVSRKSVAPTSSLVSPSSRNRFITLLAIYFALSKFIKAVSSLLL